MTDLTKTYLAKGDFCFQPRTQDEARLIQQNLLAMGFRWQKGGTVPQYLDILANGTLKLQDGIMTYSSERKVEGTLLDYNQFDPDYIADDREYLASMFNKVFDRMDALEKRLGGLEEAINPRAFDKPLMNPALGKKGKAP